MATHSGFKNKEQRDNMARKQNNRVVKTDNPANMSTGPTRSRKIKSFVPKGG